MVRTGLVTPEARGIAREAQDALQERDIQGLAVVSLSLAGGVVLAQELADRVLPMLGFSRTPTSPGGFAASGVVKFVGALALGTVAANVSGLALVVAAFLGVGHLAGAGADFFNAIQRTGFFAEANRSVNFGAPQGDSGQQNAPSASNPASGGGGAQVSV